MGRRATGEGGRARQWDGAVLPVGWKGKQEKGDDEENKLAEGGGREETDG